MTLQSELTSIFGEDGWLVERGYHHLPEQLEYALAVSSWLEGDSSQPVSLIEAETGTGKTLGYLFPVVLHWRRTGDRTVIATHTINLQNQLLYGDFQIVETYLIEKGHPLPALVQRLGMQHFVDPDRIVAHISDPPTEEQRVFLEWAMEEASTGTGLIDKWCEEYGELPDRLNENSVCITKESAADCNRAYTAMKQDARRSDIVLTSHMMVLLEAFRNSLILTEESDRQRHVLFDEADQIPASAEKLGNRRIQPNQVARELSQLIGKGSSAMDKHLLTAVRRLEEIHDGLRAIGEHTVQPAIVLGQNNRESFAPIAGMIEQMKSTCEEIGQRIRRSSLRGAEHSHQVATVTETLEWVANFQSEGPVSTHSAQAIGWSPVRRYPSLIFQRALPSMFVSRLWRLRGDRVCFTSATLGPTAAQESDRGLFQSFVGELGVAERCIGQRRSFAPTNFGELYFVLTSPEVPKPLQGAGDGEPEPEEKWMAYAGAMIDIASQSGPTLVLCPSYREARAIGRRTKNSDPIVHQYGEPLSSVVNRFVEGESRVLITPAAWQGTSIRNANGDQLIENLVITRIPFRPPDKIAERIEAELYVRYRKEAAFSLSKGKSYYQHRQLNRALIKLRQGFGRALRHQSDRATIWIADPRFARPGERSSMSYLRRAIPVRFDEAYQESQVLSLKGQRLEPAVQKISEELMEFLLI